MDDCFFWWPENKPAIVELKAFKSWVVGLRINGATLDVAEEIKFRTMERYENWVKNHPRHALDYFEYQGAGED